MMVHLLMPWLGYDRAKNEVRHCTAGEEVSVYHAAGTKLIHRRVAKWVCQEAGDPDWTPVEPLRWKMAQPQHNRMVKEAHNR